jgi:hypothetical protein
VLVTRIASTVHVTSRVSQLDPYRLIALHHPSTLTAMSFRAPRILKYNKSSSPSKSATAAEGNAVASSSNLVNVDSLPTERRPYDSQDIYVDRERLLFAPGGPFTQPVDPASRRPSTHQASSVGAGAGSDYHGLANTIRVTNPIVTDASGVEQLRYRRHKEESYRKWMNDVIPSLVVPYLTLLKQTVSLQQPANPEVAALVSPCAHGHLHRQLNVTCVYFNSE